MLITEITAKKGHLNEITLAGGDKILLDKSVCEEFSVFEGEEISAERLKEVKDISDYRRAFNRAVWYIERGSLSYKRLCEKLKTAGFSEPYIKKAADRLTELGLINDAAFAERLAENLLKSGVSKREAQQKLILKGISPALSRETLDIFECDPTEQIALLINKQYKSKLGTEEGVKKVYAALSRRGFNYSDIRKVLQDYSENSEDWYGI